METGTKKKEYRAVMTHNAYWYIGHFCHQFRTARMKVKKMCAGAGQAVMIVITMTTFKYRTCIYDTLRRIEEKWFLRVHEINHILSCINLMSPLVLHTNGPSDLTRFSP